MGLICTLAEYNNGVTDGHDKLTLKVEVESPLQISRRPIIIPLPGGSIIGIDLGTNAATISISGVVDYALQELFIKAPIVGTFAVGDIVSGAVGWNSATTPIRTAIPYATVVAVYLNATTPTSLIINGVYLTGSPTVESFFVDGEPITATTGSGATIKYDTKKVAFENLIVTQTPAAILFDPSFSQHEILLTQSQGRSPSLCR